MTRETFLIKINAGDEAEFKGRWANVWQEYKDACNNLGISNYSVWTVEGFAFGYRERDENVEESGKDIAVLERWDEYMKDACEFIANVGDMRLMYHDIGIVREDKSLIRHRVFGTILKPDCAEEYKARHQKLIDARGDSITQGPESDFTIWCANSKYIFGYCELVKSYDHDMTEDERASTIAWETRQLEIMDWLTDDVDWMTGEKHQHIEKVWSL